MVFVVHCRLSIAMALVLIRKLTNRIVERVEKLVFPHKLVFLALVLVRQAKFFRMGNAVQMDKRIVVVFVLILLQTATIVVFVRMLVQVEKPVKISFVLVPQEKFFRMVRVVTLPHQLIVE